MGFNWAFKGLILFVSAPFFVDCISEQDLDEMNIEIIRNTLYKAYLEAFFNFCKELGGTTADVMCEILAVSNEWKDYLCLVGKEC
jgi:vacuolar-type H+-ATPase subunit C/Vma6